MRTLSSLLVALFSMLCIATQPVFAATTLPTAVSTTRSSQVSAILTDPIHGMATSSVAISCTAYVTVVSGDTLSLIGNRYHVPWSSIASANAIANPNLIFPGQRFCIPAGGGASTNGPTVTTTTSTSGPTVGSGAKGPNLYSFGWCTWGAAELATRDMNGLGNAPDWTYNAARRGYPTGYAPAIGATAVFQPGYSVSGGWVSGVQTVGWGTGEGHVAHVVGIQGNAFEIQEMNNSYYGGWGRWDTVWIALIPGVSFIY
jgi:surface antigen